MQVTYDSTGTQRWYVPNIHGDLALAWGDSTGNKLTMTDPFGQPMDPVTGSIGTSTTDDRVCKRMNSTIRTVNRIVLFFGALLAGVLATYLGYRLTIGIGAAVFVVSAVVLAVSPFRDVRHDDAQEWSSQA